MDKGCSGDEATTATESTLDSTVEQMSIAKGKGQLSEDKYDEIITQVNTIREANDRIKCLVDTLPKESVTPESIIDDIDSDIEQ
jgi:hypothetical protein